MHRIVTVFVLTLAGVTGVQAQTKWDLPAAYASTNFHTQLLQEFAQDVAARSHGKLAITVHDNASLYKGPEIKRAVQGGQAQIGEILLMNYANEDPLFELDALPFLTNSYESAWRLYQVQKPWLQKKLAAQGMRLLYSVAWTTQGIYSKRTLHTVADLKGAKWRSQSPAMARIAELVGAQAVTIQSAELTQALATGTIDSFISSSTTGRDIKVYDYINAFYDTEVSLPKNAVVVNLRAFNALDAATQEALLQAAAVVEARGWQVSQARTKQDMAELEQHGMTIVKPAPALMAGLNEVGAIMLADWLKKMGADGQALIDAYKTAN